LLIYNDIGPETYVYLHGLAIELFTPQKVDLLIENFDSIADGFDAACSFVNEVDYYLAVLSNGEEPESEEPEFWDTEEPAASEKPDRLDKPDRQDRPETEDEPEQEDEQEPDETEDNATIAEAYGRLIDVADLLSDAQEKILKAKLDAIVAKYKCDVVIVALDSLDGETSQAYADDLFDYGEYGVGSGDDGILFLLSIEDRDWAISTYGFGIKAFTDWGQDYIMGKVLTYLGDDEYYNGFMTFASLSDDFLAQARNGAPYDTNNKLKASKTTEQIVFNIGVSLVIGLVAGAIVVAVLKSQLKSVKHQQLAHEYIRRDSFHVTRGNDQFLYKHVDRTAKPKNNGSGGGSSTHSSSSGRSHGGSSGKF
jgi:uncharacterized protein